MIEDLVCANFAHTAVDGKKYKTNFYSSIELDTKLPTPHSLRSWYFF